jgi:GR25 family glycosyltransferase involved in LPS biosynthesis
MAPNSCVMVIDFHDPRTKVSVDMGASLAAEPIWIRAVNASMDKRWLDRSDESGDLEIGRGAAGCLLAHQDAWRAAADMSDDDDIIILESDAVMTTFGRKHLNSILEQGRATGANLIQLGTGRGHSSSSQSRTVGVQVASAKDFIEQRLLKIFPPLIVQAYGMGTVAYALRPRYAKWLARQRLGFGVPVDNWLRMWSLDARHSIYRCRQDCWQETGRQSGIDIAGRV